MDEQTTQNPESESKNKKVIPIVIGALILLAVVGVFAYQGMKDEPAPKISQTPTPTVSEAPSISVSPTSAFKDGTYNATGNYVSPGGPRDVDVTIVIKNGVVTESTFEGHATDPNSKRFQGEFAEGYKTFVVGKPIDEIAIVKVSGSSLTPKGFMDALQKIKTQATS